MSYFSNYLDSIASINPDTKFLVLCNDSYTTDNGYPEDGYSTYKFVRTLQFLNEQDMLEWVKNETTPKQWSSSVRNPNDILVIPVSAIMHVSVETKITTSVS